MKKWRQEIKLINNRIVPLILTTKNFYSFVLAHLIS